MNKRPMPQPVRLYYSQDDDTLNTFRVWRSDRPREFAIVTAEMLELIKSSIGATSADG